jgi:hypothetical protein
MRRFRLIGVTFLAALVCTAIATVSASAEPVILVLPGQGFKTLKYEGKSAAGSKAILETAGGKTIACESALALATYTALSGKPDDSEAGTGDVHFEKCKKGPVACRSEAESIKDPVETILTLLALTAAAELTSAKVLQFLIINSIKGTLFINCGGVKEEIIGAVPCLVGGSTSGTELAAGATVTITCTSTPKGLQVTGMCTETIAACLKLGKEPLLANIGAGFENASEAVAISGSHNEMVTFDF